MDGDPSILSESYYELVVNAQHTKKDTERVLQYKWKDTEKLAEDKRLEE